MDSILGEDVDLLVFKRFDHACPLGGSIVPFDLFQCLGARGPPQREKLSHICPVRTSNNCSRTPLSPGSNQLECTKRIR